MGAKRKEKTFWPGLGTAHDACPDVTSGFPIKTNLDSSESKTNPQKSAISLLSVLPRLSTTYRLVAGLRFHLGP